MTSLFADFDGHCRVFGERAALVDGINRCTYTYADLRRRVRSFRLMLREAGVNCGDRLTVLSSDPFQQAVAIAACMSAGVIANPLSPALPENRAAEFIRHAAPAAILADRPELVPGSVRHRQPILTPASLPRTGLSSTANDVSQGGLLVFTSGTTGTAKGVLLSVGNVEANIATASQTFGYHPGWVSACLLPLYHTFAIVSDLLPLLLTGGSSVVLPTFDLPNTKMIVGRIREYRVNSYSAPPVIFEAFLAMNCLTDTELRFAIAGAAPLREQTRVEYETRFRHPIVPCYGLSETTCFATISPPDAIRPGSVGKPAGIDIAVLDVHGNPLPAGETGEIALRGASVIRNGYYRDDGRYAGSFTLDGYFLSGDLGSVDADGYVYVTGRKKNMVIRGGEKVYLEDVDRSLADHPGVADAASVVVCRRDQRDRAVSFVAPRGGAALPAEAIVAHLRARLGPKHIPDDIVFTDRIPRTATGKPKHTELHALYGSEERRETV